MSEMTNREAMEIVLGMAETYWHIDEPDCEAGKRQQEAIFQMQDYMNDLMREELGTKLDEELYNNLPIKNED